MIVKKLEDIGITAIQPHIVRRELEKYLLNFSRPPEKVAIYIFGRLTLMEYRRDLRRYEVVEKYYDILDEDRKQLLSLSESENNLVVYTNDAGSRMFEQ